MHRASIGLTVALLVLSALTRQADARVDVGVSISDEGLSGFYLAVGEYYRVPQREVLVIKERRIPDEEIPVVFFLANGARVAPATIIDLRLGGKSWMDITLQFGLSPSIFYVPVRAVPGPPYGKAYGYYKKRPRREWKTIVLADADVINFVNLKFISKHYSYAPEAVISMREQGKPFVIFHQEVRKAKRGHRERAR